MVPPGTFGASVIPPQLASEVSTLASSGAQVELTESEGWAILILPRYKLPIGYNMEMVELLVKVPLSYRMGTLICSGRMRACLQ